MRPFRADLGDGGVVKRAGLVRIQRKVELILPAKLEARFADRIIAEYQATIQGIVDGPA